MGRRPAVHRPRWSWELHGLLASMRGQLFEDEEFAELYCSDNGRDSVPPSLMSTAVSASRRSFRRTRRESIGRGAFRSPVHPHAARNGDRLLLPFPPLPAIGSIPCPGRAVAAPGRPCVRAFFCCPETAVPTGSDR